MVASEAKLLSDRGHAVRLYQRTNDEIESSGRVADGIQAMWSRRTVREIGGLIRESRPDLIHVHNTWPLISPSIYWLASKVGIPIVQTLHNYRVSCLQAMFSRDGRICEDCLGGLPWRGVVRRCYRQSFTQSAALAASVSAHRMIGTYTNHVSRFIALTEFAKAKYVAGGLAPERIMVKPNFADVEPPGDGARAGLLFVGRLSAEKGIELLVKMLGQIPEAYLDVIGAGPLEGALAGHPRVRLHGWQSEAYIHAAMRKAALLLMPSTVYENLPRTLVEAYGNALPVVAGKLGSMPDLIEHGGTGFLYAYESPVALARTVSDALANPERLQSMGRIARNVYESKYTPEINYETLTSIYRAAIDVGKS